MNTPCFAGGFKCQLQQQPPAASWSRSFLAAIRPLLTSYPGLPSHSVFCLRIPSPCFANPNHLRTPKFGFRILSSGPLSRKRLAASSCILCSLPSSPRFIPQKHGSTGPLSFPDNVLRRSAMQQSGLIYRGVSCWLDGCGSLVVGCRCEVRSWRV